MRFEVLTPERDNKEILNKIIINSELPSIKVYHKNNPHVWHSNLPELIIEHDCINFLLEHVFEITYDRGILDLQKRISEGVAKQLLSVIHTKYKQSTTVESLKEHIKRLIYIQPDFTVRLSDKQLLYFSLTKYLPSNHHTVDRFIVDIKDVRIINGPSFECIIRLNDLILDQLNLQEWAFLEINRAKINTINTDTKCTTIVSEKLQIKLKDTPEDYDVYVIKIYNPNKDNNGLFIGKCGILDMKYK